MAGRARLTTEPSRKAMKDATIAAYSTRFSTLDMAAAGVPDMAAAFLTARLGGGTGFGLSLAPSTGDYRCPRIR